MVSNLAPAKVKTVLDYALEYSSRGYSVIPIEYSTKRAIVEWDVYQKRKPSDSEINTWFGSNQPKNIAIVCGQVSGGLVVTEFDVPSHYESFCSLAEIRLGLPVQCITPVVKTARGFHVYWLVKSPIKSAKFPNMEIRSDGNYVLAPPSKHPSGSLYELINPEVIIPHTINSLEDIGINVNQPKPDSTIGGDNWVTRLMQGVPEGQRDDTCTRLAGYYLTKMPPDIVRGLLYPFADRCTPPMHHEEVDKVVDSITKKDDAGILNGGYTLSPLNSDREDFTFEKEFSHERRQVTRQVGDKLSGYGDLSIPFDKFLKENPEPHWKKDVAEMIGTTYKSDGFQTLVRRRANATMIRISHGGDKIQWVNKDWKNSLIPLQAGERAFLKLLLPFGVGKYILTPEHCQIVVAGDVGSGKTHFGYLLAELNVGKIPIRHFVNEIGDSKAIRNLDDFPVLLEHFDKDYYLINQDKEQLEVAENLDPEGLNIYDYLHLPASKEWFLWLQKELSKLSQKLTTGAIAVFLQKKRGVSLAMGGEGTKMQCEVYLNLNITKDVKGDETDYGYKEGRIDIIKCRNWNSKINPETLSLLYRTAPKWGKLTPVSLDWKPMERN
jgi:hypothetical protein